MRYSPDEFPVLYKGTAAHALDDAAGGLKQVRVRDPDEKIPAVGLGLGIDFQNFHRIIPWLPIGDGGADGGGAGADLLPGGGGDGLTLPGAPDGAENALAGIDGHGAKKGVPGDGTLQLPRCAGFALLDRSHRCWINLAAGHFQQAPLAVADSVTQGAESAGVRVEPGDGADAGDALPEIDSQPGAVFGDLRLQMNGLFHALPAEHQLHGALGMVQRPADILSAGDFRAVDGKDPVSRLEACFLRRGQFIVKGCHRHRAGG